MRKPIRILVKIGITLLIMVALAISALRLAFPYINDYRQPLFDTLSRWSGVPIEVNQITGSWEPYGPTLEMNYIKLKTPAGEIDVERITMALDVWQSLLHFRWQFRDLTFYRLHGDLNIDLREYKSGSQEEPDPSSFSSILLTQLNYFDLRDGRVSFIGLSGARVTLNIPQLSWLNSYKRHRAEGTIGVSSMTGEHGLLQMRLDLRDTQSLFGSGTVYFQADDVDALPWLSTWIQTNTGLDDANVSLASWLYLDKGKISGSDLLLKKGSVNWHAGKTSHQLDLDNLMLKMSRKEQGWLLDISRLNIKTDSVAWPVGQASLFWQPGTESSPNGQPVSNELRLRAANLDLSRINPLLPIFNFLTPDALNIWSQLNPQANVDFIALDIPLQQTEKIRFQANLHNASWHQWKLMPGADRVTAGVFGSLNKGEIQLSLEQSKLPYEGMFRAPLEIGSANARLNWEQDSNKFHLWGQGIDVQANAIWVNGDFDYFKDGDNDPWLGILAGIRLYDGSQAWRYFPEHLMGTALTNYLSSAVQGGTSDNATLIYAGIPAEFPYPNKTGLFEVYAPLKSATFKFQPDWPALTKMDIVLDFINDGLWMKAPSAALDRVNGRNIEANIPRFGEKMLEVIAEVDGQGADVKSYFDQSPLKGAIGSALEQVQIAGKVNGRLHLDIPLDGKLVKAAGTVALKDNDIYVKPIDSTLKRVSGEFQFDNGKLTGDRLTATWFNQPIGLNFSTEQGKGAYNVNIGLNGNWAVNLMPWIPDSLHAHLAGRAKWRSQVDITLPAKGDVHYEVALIGDLNSVSSHLPKPLDKAAGKALPVNLMATGDTKGFLLNGTVADNQHINSQWLLADKRVKLSRFIWQSQGKRPELPQSESAVITLPEVDGGGLLGLFAGGLQSSLAGDESHKLELPKHIEVTSPSVYLANQYWPAMKLTVSPQRRDTLIEVQSRNLRGSLTIPSQGAWYTDIDYLYYSPKTAAIAEPTIESRVKTKAAASGFSQWPALVFNCRDCWIMGQSIGEVNADLHPEGNVLYLRQGHAKAAGAELILKGEWREQYQYGRYQQAETVLSGSLKGDKLDRLMRYWGVITPMKDAPFDMKFSLSWNGEPWQPEISSLNGSIQGQLDKGEIENVGGRAGQLLRLLSFNALLRKLQLDFSDTFKEGFYFDSIKFNSDIKRGVMSSQDFMVNGLSADIAMNGSVDFVRRKLDVQAIVTPEVSATVSVATAFVINPIAGAAVLAASQALSPLWSKISLIRYQISGSLDNPSVSEILRQPKGDNDNEKR